jgi:hypothetical protein
LRSGECKFDTNTDVEIHYVQYKEHAGFFHDFACKITKL